MPVDKLSFGHSVPYTSAHARLAGSVPASRSRHDASRQLDERLTKVAAADVLSAHMYTAKLRKCKVYRRSGISRSHLDSLLRAEKQMSLFIFLELSRALRFEDPCDLLRDLLDRRSALQLTSQASTLAIADPPLT